MTSQFLETAEILTHVATKLSLVNTLPEVSQIIVEAARALAKSDGATFVLRDGGNCHYVDENSSSPLWKGKKFPLETCISGWSIQHREVVMIRDIYQDVRIPHAAYRPTFVKSLCMVPIRFEVPMGAIGSYWSKEHQPAEEEVKSLQILADCAAIALENLQHKTELAQDLRTPFSVIVGLAEMLKVAPIAETARRAVGQIERALSLHRASNGKLEKRLVDLTSHSTKIMANLRAIFPSRVIHAQIQQNLVAHADPSLMYIVLEKAISNAIKNSAMLAESKIEVGQVEKGKDSAVFYVKDNGRGFDPSQLASIAHIVGLHGGEVKTESTKKEGATLFFSLPL